MPDLSELHEMLAGFYKQGALNLSDDCQPIISDILKQIARATSSGATYIKCVIEPKYGHTVRDDLRKLKFKCALKHEKEMNLFGRNQSAIYVWGWSDKKPECFYCNESFSD